MYAILKSINGNLFIHAEGIETIESAKSQYHGLSQILWNAPDVETATIELVDTNLRIIDGYREIITHTVNA